MIVNALSSDNVKYLNPFKASFSSKYLRVYLEFSFPKDIFGKGGVGERDGRGELGRPQLML